MALSFISGLTFTSIDSLAQSVMQMTSRQGTVQLASGTATINDPLITANSKVFIDVQVPGGTLGAQYKAVPTGGSATISAISLTNVTQVLDTSTIQYNIIY